MRIARNFALLSGLFSRRERVAGSESQRDLSNTRESAGFTDEDLHADSPEAVERAKTAAEKGNPAAQNSFGLRLASGLGVLRSELEARRWLNRAAAQGYAEAQFNLGNLCHSLSLSFPAGSSEGRVEAYMWFHLAAAQGHPKAEASCEMLNLKLTDAELREGNRRINEFRSRMELSTKEP
jgi:TPR repeat protein